MGLAATTDTIYIDGYSPTAIALHWDTSGDLCFNDYEIQESTYSSGGPWTTQGTITDSAEYEWMQIGFSPGGVTWWQDVDQSGCGGGNQASNVVKIVNPSVATLSYVDPTSSSLQLTWDNNALYYGLLAFESYAVYRSVNGGAFSAISTITSESTMTYTDSGLSGLATGTSYSYYVETTDHCSGTWCNGWLGTTDSVSNTVTQLAISQPTASPVALDVGQTTSLHVAVIGGTGSYSYAWSGLPGGCSSSDRDPLPCTPSSAGSSQVSVTVTDSNGISASSLPVSVTVNPRPSVTSFTVSPDSTTLGKSTVFTVVASGGTGTLSYSYSDLPTGCVGSNTHSVSCTPSAAGTYTVTVAVTDQAGVVATSTTTVTIESDPTVQLTPASPSILQGQAVTLTAAASGGGTPYSYSWTGLPTGCAAPSGSTLTCTPSETGTFAVTVTVTDVNGVSTTAVATLSVNPSFIGMPAVEGYAVLGGGIAVVVVVAAVVSALLVRRQRSSRPPPQTHRPTSPPSGRSPPANP